MVEKVRKIHSNKKRDVKPTVDIELKDCLSRICYITSTPIKDVAAWMIENSLISRKMMDNLSRHLKSPFN